MFKTALITGASSGIGFELAYIHASKGDNLVLVARNEERLKELKVTLEKQFCINVYIIAKDLSLPNSPQEVFDETNNHHIQIDYLINNAGRGDYGYFKDTDWDKEFKMIQLNVVALTHLTKLYVNQMLVRKEGKILNIASVAAFQPGPKMAVYFATKSFVLNFSEAIHQEVSKHGITVTTLCPGPTNTGFFDAAGMSKIPFFNQNNLPIAKDVALCGYQAMMKGKQVVIHGFVNKIMVFLVRFTPRTWVVKIAALMMKD
jgi:uncharacterized protein